MILTPKLPQARSALGKCCCSLPCSTTAPSLSIFAHCLTQCHYSCLHSLFCLFEGCQLVCVCPFLWFRPFLETSYWGRHHFALTWLFLHAHYQTQLLWMLPLFFFPPHCVFLLGFSLGDLWAWDDGLWSSPVNN